MAMELSWGGRGGRREGDEWFGEVGVLSRVKEGDDVGGGGDAGVERASLVEVVVETEVAANPATRFPTLLIPSSPAAAPPDTNLPATSTKVPSTPAP